MTKRQRTLLFLSLLGLFLLSAPALVLYSQGYRVDLRQGRITQTGAFYIKAAPLRADVLVDGELVKRTDFLFGSALTKNFFPGQHAVEVAKEGYHSWQKVLEVKERQVTEAKNVLLFKKEPAFRVLADGVERFWVSPDRNYALLQEQLPGQAWELALLNLNTGGKEPLLEQSRGQEEILDIQWAQDSQRFLLQQTLREQVVSEVRGISAGRPCFEAPCGLAYLGANIGSISFVPAESGTILFTKFSQTGQILLEANYGEQAPAAPLANNVLAFAAQGSQATWLDGEGTLWQKDLASANAPSVFAQAGRVPRQEVSSVLFAQGNTILLREGNALFLQERGAQEAREVLSPVNEVVLSPDGTKAALRNQSELWVLFLKEQPEQPRRRKGELVLLTRFSESIGQVFWVNSTHLLFSLGGSLRAMEIDTRDRLNVAEIATFPEPEFSWDNQKGALYVLSQGAFSVSEKIVR